MQQHLDFYYQRTTKSFKRNHKTTELLCDNCENKFLANRNNARFCSSSCRSQFWLKSKNMKVITLTVPIDMDEALIEELKQNILNRGLPAQNPIAAASMEPKVPTAPHIVKLPAPETQVFEACNDLEDYLHTCGFFDYKIPRFDSGAYYDDGLTIKKVEGGWETVITKKAS
jgi:hypothetical protein